VAKKSNMNYPKYCKLAFLEQLEMIFSKKRYIGVFKFKNIAQTTTTIKFKSIGASERQPHNNLMKC